MDRAARQKWLYPRPYGSLHMDEPVEYPMSLIFSFTPRLIAVPNKSAPPETVLTVSWLSTPIASADGMPADD